MLFCFQCSFRGKLLCTVSRWVCRDVDVKVSRCVQVEIFLIPWWALLEKREKSKKELKRKILVRRLTKQRKANIFVSGMCLRPSVRLDWRQAEGRNGCEKRERKVNLRGERIRRMLVMQLLSLKWLLSAREVSRYEALSSNEVSADYCDGLLVELLMVSATSGDFAPEKRKIIFLVSSLRRGRRERTKEMA